MGQGLIMADSFLLDTDILIDFLRGHNKAVDFVTANSHKIILSSIVVAELYAGVKGAAELTALDNFISLFTVIPVTSEIARVGGLFKRDYAKSHGIGLADSIIAATCESENASLKTLNVKHYPMMKDLKPAYKK
ncbi:MAG: type II toxin-antitoxin system VapC family toxin [Desulfamplus sp.]|nr:type II toxin-antitoxin system VapC family toxin [Desulfamplus sp.]